jgi:hypothetical protein
MKPFKLRHTTSESHVMITDRLNSIVEHHLNLTKCVSIVGIGRANTKFKSNTRKSNHEKQHAGSIPGPSATRAVQERELQSRKTTFSKASARSDSENPVK